MKDINRKKSDYKTSSQSYIDRSNGEEETSERSLLLLDNLEWLTTAEAAYYLRKSSAAIRQMVCRGQLRARKFHRRLYFKKVELNQAIDISFY
jgi:excisionase family DNA binding protein